MSARRLVLDRLSVHRGARTVVDQVSLEIGPGEFVGLIGPNGAGKTTLMRAALGLVPAKGTRNLAEFQATVRARAVAWLPQSRDIAWPLSVEKLVGIGRAPWLGFRPGLDDTDKAAVAAAISRLDLDSLKLRPATELSGGEQALVLIARAIAQDTPLVMADEPIAGLDPAHQLSVMGTFAGLAREGKTVLVSIHDLGLAARFCERLLVLDKGRLVADGPPSEILSPDLLARVFGIRAVFEMREDGPVFQPVGPATEVAHDL